MGWKTGGGVRGEKKRKGGNKGGREGEGVMTVHFLHHAPPATTVCPCSQLSRPVVLVFLNQLQLTSPLATSFFLKHLFPSMIWHLPVFLYLHLLCLFLFLVPYMPILYTFHLTVLFIFSLLQAPHLRSALTVSIYANDFQSTK